MSDEGETLSVSHVMSRDSVRRHSHPLLFFMGNV